MLEDEVHGTFDVHCVEFEGESAEGGAMSVVSAFVGDSGIAGSVGDVEDFVDWESVHVCAEGDSWGAFDVAGGEEPFSAVDDGEGSVGLDEVHEGAFCAGFLAGELGELVELTAQGGNLLQVVRVHMCITS